MSKYKESSSSKRDHSDDCLTSYLNMKSPLLGQLEFDVSVLPPPVDPKFLDYEINDEILNYEVTGLELSDRLSNFSEFNSGISDEFLNGICFTGCGIENKQLMESIESKFLDNLTSKNDKNEFLLKVVRSDVLDTMKFFEDVKMSNLMNKARESLPSYMQNLLSPDLDPNFINEKKLKSLKREDSMTFEVEQKPETYESWSSMSTEERIEAYVTELEKTFVSPDQLIHPNNKYSRIVKVYNVLPNMALWNNRYIQVGIDGVTFTSEEKSKLQVNGVLKLARETQTQRFFEYYKRKSEFTSDDTLSNPGTSRSGLDEMSLDTVNKHVETVKPDKDDFNYLFDDVAHNKQDDIDELFNEDEDVKEQSKSEQMSPSYEHKIQNQDSRERGEVYKFIRQYSSQKYSKSSGTENYYLMSLPPGLKEKFIKNNSLVGVNDLKTEEIVEILPIRGPKLVLSKAGVTKRPDIRIAYVN